jgi:hypothetical protein
MVAALAAGVALAVSPAHATVLAPASRTVQVSNLGAKPVAVDVAWRSLGRGISPRGWLHISPAHLALRSGGHGFLTLRAGPGASPGDHNLLVLVTGRSADPGGVGVRLRLGVRVRIRAPGRLVHRLALTGIGTRRSRSTRAVLVSVANRGNVTEQLRGRVSVTLTTRHRVLSRLRFGRAREVYPGTRATIVLPYAGSARGPVIAVVIVHLGGRARPLQRRYRLLL